MTLTLDIQGQIFKQIISGIEGSIVLLYYDWIDCLVHRPHSRQVSPWPHRAVVADQRQWILLKANNASWAAMFVLTSMLESDLVLIINFNSTHK